MSAEAVSITGGVPEGGHIKVADPPPKKPHNPFPRGARVKCHREPPFPVTWKPFQGRIGTVRVPDNLGEVGVIFGSPKSNNEATTWFLPGQLMRVKKDSG